MLKYLLIVCVLGSSTHAQDFVTFDQFSNAITSNGYPAPNQEQHKNFNQYARSTGKINTLQEAAMALAQFIHESGGLQFKEELRCKDSKCPNEYRQPGCDNPEKYYYGRGYIQLTWCTNYRQASYDIFGDVRLVNYPDAVAHEEPISWGTSFWYWGKNVHPRAGVQRGEFGDSTRAINPGECGTGHPGPERRFRYYGKVRAAFGLPGPGNSAGC